MDDQGQKLLFDGILKPVFLTCPVATRTKGMRLVINAMTIELAICEKALLNCQSLMEARSRENAAELSKSKVAEADAVKGYEKQKFLIAQLCEIAGHGGQDQGTANTEGNDPESNVDDAFELLEALASTNAKYEEDSENAEEWESRAGVQGKQLRQVLLHAFMPLQWALQDVARDLRDGNLNRLHRYRDLATVEDPYAQEGADREIEELQTQLGEFFKLHKSHYDAFKKREQEFYDFLGEEEKKRLQELADQYAEADGAPLALNAAGLVPHYI